MLGMLLICEPFFYFFFIGFFTRLFVADGKRVYRQVLIELAPSYFRYIDSTANKASALAKLMGFYTVEVKNLETGTVQAKHDLLVMENLFYDQKVAKTFDLKGIQSRRVKLANDGTQRQTLFDGEWIEGNFIVHVPDDDSDDETRHDVNQGNIELLC